MLRVCRPTRHTYRMLDQTSSYASQTSTREIVAVTLSWWSRTSWAHYFTGGVALWLGITTWMFVERPGPPAAQNEISVAVFLLMMFILPNQASDPPAGWRDEIVRQQRRD